MYLDSPIRIDTPDVNPPPRLATANVLSHCKGRGDASSYALLVFWTHQSLFNHRARTRRTSTEIIVFMYMSTRFKIRSQGRRPKACIHLSVFTEGEESLAPSFSIHRVQTVHTEFKQYTQSSNNSQFSPHDHKYISVNKDITNILHRNQ